MGSCKYMSKSQKWLHSGIFILSIIIAMNNVECKDITYSPKFLVNDNKIYENENFLSYVGMHDHDKKYGKW